MPHYKGLCGGGGDALVATITAAACFPATGMIPTFVSEMGETLMNELDDASEIFTAVESLESDHWSSASSSMSSSPGELLCRRPSGGGHFGIAQW